MLNLLRSRSIGLSLVFALGCMAPALAQGVQTGTIAGVVESVDRRPLPWVTITATSPNLQSPRIAVSDTNGVYSVRGLTPGPYQVTFELQGFQSASRDEGR